MFKVRAALLLYQLITLLIAPLGVLFLLWKKRRDPPYGRRCLELLGFMPVQFKSSIWFHTVSVGEVMAARPVIEAFVKRHPKLNVVVTTTTTTGAAAASAIKGTTHLYAPLDSPAALYRFFKAVRPRHLFIMETELWPNLLHKARKHYTHVTIFNARMPESTCRAYEKHLSLVKPLIADQLNMVICQTRDDAERFARIGVPPERIRAVNSLKYDVTLRDEIFAGSRKIKEERLPGRVLCAASLHDGEEELLLQQYQDLVQKEPDIRLVLVPRHLSCADRAEAFIRERTQLSAQRRTQCHSDLSDFQSQILIGDSIGEMEFYLGLSDLIFMGGSLIDIGGHNPLEPAYFSLPVLTGPYYYNFKEQFEALIDAGGAFLCPQPERLAQIVQKLFADPAALQDAGLKAMAVQQQGRGALKKTLEIMEQTLLRPADERHRQQD